MRTFLVVLGIVSVIYPGLFLYERTTTFLYNGAAPDDVAATAESERAVDNRCVIVLIFDEFSLVPLLDAAGDIDRESFPNFYAFAHDSVWFRHAIANYPYTNMTVASMAGGIYLRRGRGLTLRGGIPFITSDNLPDNYSGNRLEDVILRHGFTLEERRQQSTMQEILESLFRYIEVTVPATSISWLIPHIANRYKIEEAKLLKNFACRGRTYKPLHLMITHAPYILNEDGTFIYTIHNKFTIGGNYLETYRNYGKLLRYVDKVFGDFISQLKRQGLYERSIIVVTSDHGICWTNDCPGRESFKAIRRIELSLARIPMMIRAPGLTPRVDDGDYQHIDFAPTLLHALGIDYRPDFPIDGRSALSGTLPVRPRLFFISPNLPPVDLGDPMRAVSVD